MFRGEKHVWRRGELRNKHKTHYMKTSKGLGMVVYACHPSYAGGIGGQKKA
jgi:hypothetical protein